MSGRLCLVVVCAVQATVQASPVVSDDLAPNLAQTILLTDAVETHGARCLDGSPQRLWCDALF